MSTTWGDTISCAEQACNTVAMVSREKHITHCRTSTRDGQLHSGRRVQNNPVIGRMAATSGSIQADSGDSGQMQHRSVCNTIQCPTGAVCQLETRPQCSRDGCTTTSLGQMGRLCIPSLLPNRKMPQEDPRRQSISDSCGTGVEVTAVVPGIARSISGLYPDTAEGPDVVDRSVQQPTSLGCNRTVTTSCLEDIRHRQ